ncbi:MAG: M28 family peptidase [Planctomycetota bacterium]
MQIVSRRALARISVLLLLLAGSGCAYWWFFLRMPGESHTGPVGTPAPTLAEELRADVEALAGEFGPRGVFYPQAQRRAGDWIAAQLQRAGYEPGRQPVTAMGETFDNIEAERPGNEEIVVIGAHYDTASDSPGANDNASGVAATLALARRFADRPTRRTLRFVLFTNEEPPFFATDDMGSAHYARRCKERGENVFLMISLETIGYFSDEENSQEFPLATLEKLYGNRGNFIAFVGNVATHRMTYRAVDVFRAKAEIPSHGTTLPALVQGVDWSDHRCFWEQGYRAFMVTDTAPFRYPHYHERTDTPDKLHYDKLALVVEGMEHVIEDLVNGE